MANFAVNCADDGLVRRGNELLDRLIQPGENKSAALARIFSITEECLDDECLKAGGVDTRGLESAITTIPNLFMASITARDQIATEVESKVCALKEQHKKAESNHLAEIEQLKSQKDAAIKEAKDAINVKEQAEKNLMAEKKVRESAEMAAKDKEIISQNLAIKLSDAEKKINGYDDLKAALLVSEEGRKTAEQHARDIKRDADEATKEAARTAEKEMENAIRDLERKYSAEINRLMDDLRISKSETEVARRDAETARQAVVAELSEVHRTEVLEIRKMLDERTDELMKARESIGDLKLLLEREKTEARNKA